MRIPKPHWKATHKCWYVKLGGKFHRLDPDKVKAFALYAELLSQRNVQAGGTASRALTVADLGYTFLEWVDKHRANETYLWYREYLHGMKGAGKHAATGFLNFVPTTLRVVDLRPYHLENWLDARYAKADDNTKAGAVTAVLRCFNWAAKMGYIEASPLKGVEKPRREARGEECYIRPEQWAKVIEAVRNGNHEVEPFLDYLTVMKETGCRPQEIRKVEARHLDHEHKQWTFPVKESKGKITKRHVLLGDGAYAICRRLALIHPTGPLFLNSDGRAWTNFAVACRFKRITKKVGFRVFAYAIRHTFATEAIINGVDIVTLAELMGHKDLTMLRRIYQHVSKDRQHMEASRQRATERLSG